MRAILSIAAASLVLVGCEAIDETLSSSATAEATTTCTTQVTKTGVVEVCS